MDFTEPMTHCPGAHPLSPHSSRRLSNSTASPTGVPVAWHSIRSTSCGCHPAARVRRAHRPELPLLRGREQVAVHVVRQPDRGDDGVNLVAVLERVGEPLQHEHARAFAHHQPVGAGVEGRTPAARRERPELREPHLRVLAVRARAAAGEHRVGAAGEQLVARELDRVQRRRARRVERETPAAEAQALREQPRGQSRDVAVQRVLRVPPRAVRGSRRAPRGTGRSRRRWAGRCCRGRRRPGRGSRRQSWRRATRGCPRPARGGTADRGRPRYPRRGRGR